MSGVLAVTHMAIGPLAQSRMARYAGGLMLLLAGGAALWFGVMADRAKPDGAVAILSMAAALFLLVCWTSGMVYISSAFTAPAAALTPGYRRAMIRTVVLRWAVLTWVLPFAIFAAVPGGVALQVQAIAWLVGSGILMLAGLVFTHPMLSLLWLPFMFFGQQIDGYGKAVIAAAGPESLMVAAGGLNILMLLVLLWLLFSGGSEKIAARNRRIIRYQAVMNDPAKAQQINHPLNRLITGRGLYTFFIDRLLAKRAPAGNTLLRYGFGVGWHWANLVVGLGWLLLMALVVRLWFGNLLAVVSAHPSLKIWVPFMLGSSALGVISTMTASRKEQALLMLLPGAPAARQRSGWLIRSIAVQMATTLLLLIPAAIAAGMLLGLTMEVLAPIAWYLAVGAVALAPWLYLEYRQFGVKPYLVLAGPAMTALALFLSISQFEDQPVMQAVVVITWVAAHLAATVWLLRRRRATIALPLGNFSV